MISVVRADRKTGEAQALIPMECSAKNFAVICKRDNFGFMAFLTDVTDSDVIGAIVCEKIFTKISTAHGDEELLWLQVDGREHSGVKREFSVEIDFENCVTHKDGEAIDAIKASTGMKKDDFVFAFELQ